MHRACLILGSNIEPEFNLPRAVRELAAFGEIDAASQVWETPPVGGAGPNFLNACVRLLTEVEVGRFKSAVSRRVEAELGRRRGRDKFAPRPIDIDLVAYDEEPLDLEEWRAAHVIVPLAEILPALPHPLWHEPLRRAAERLRTQAGMRPRPDVVLRPPGG
jgi:2-amino-4-hydroxy-6-hydroxymethyldihydropteridine diphosphokinase